MHVVDVPPEQVGTHKAGIIEVYRAVFTEAPWNEPADYADGYGERLEFEDADDDGFRLVVALDGGRVIGFASGVGWDAHYSMCAAISSELPEEWTADAFFFLELAVLPEYRGRGIGGRLHDALLAGVEASTAILTTNRVGHPAATALYVRRGWRMLLPEWGGQDGTAEPIHVMGLADVSVFTDDRPTEGRPR